ncbi:MAG: T9SS type A sorting domain-containing protein [Bacteroidales bacterium]
MKTKIILILSFLLAYLNTDAQKIKVLFLGNSYTASNNLPEIIRDLGLTTGDTLEYSSNTPGGYTLRQHTTNQTTLNLIRSGGWDFVVLQEQSQLPSFPDDQVVKMVYPYAARLDSLIKSANPCSTTLFFMTWGRKNGDHEYCPTFPPVCTYEGMDSLLQLRYTIMAEDNEAAIAPVAKVWRKIRKEHPEIELYHPDESHPENSGSYAAACTFYSIMFGKDPALTKYDYVLPHDEATIIKNIAKEVVFDSLAYWYRFDTHILPLADFSYSISGRIVEFTNLSVNADKYVWYFGDGRASTQVSPVHVYPANGQYEAKLIAIENNCNKKTSINKTINIDLTGINDTEPGDIITVYPNPAGNTLYLKTKSTAKLFSIYNSRGENMITGSLKNTGTDHTIDISDFKSGIYNLRLTTETDHSYSIKFLKE